MTNEELVAYELIVTRTGGEVLVQTDKAGSSLPWLSIPRQCRPAAALTEALKAQWDLTGLCIGRDGCNGPGRAVQYQLVEARDSHWQPPEGFDWHEWTDSTRANLSAEQAGLVAEALSGRSSGPFASLGWIDRLKAELEPQIAPRKFTGRFEQLNSSEYFALVRLETDGAPIWFKATGAPNAHERAVTLWLTRQFPELLPPLVADCPEWNGWAMEEAGVSLRQLMRLDRWQAATEVLARIQVGCIDKTSELFAAGAADHRFGHILANVDEFFEAVEELMALQPKTPPAVLTRQELSETADAVLEACDYLASLHVPDTLLHGDISPGSIFVTDERCVIGDWCESYVGFPFLTFEHMLEHLAGELPDSRGWLQSLRDVYRAVWSSVLTESTMDRIALAVPLVAVFAHAVGRNFWRNPEHRKRALAARQYRSLARRMYREAAALRKSRIA